MFKELVDKGVIEERALRLVNVQYVSDDNDILLGAYIDNFQIQNFLRSEYKEILKKWSDDLKSFAIEQLTASGYEFHWICHFEGLHYELRTLTPSEKALLAKTTNVHEQINELPEALREISVRMLELGLDQQIVETIKAEELYNIKACTILAHYENTFWMLRVGIEARKLH
jgi:DNA-binding transcriptional MerR regulator